jgi:acyl-CoA reductase-like NAD-dependent aldehyde dehydrogenase
MRSLNGCFYDGAWQPSTGDSVIPVVNPYTEEVIGDSPIATREDVDAAVTSAHRALGGDWADSTPEERIDLVLRLRDELSARADDLAADTSASMGAPYEGYRTLAGSLGLIDAYVADARQVRWEYLRTDPSGDALIVRRPVGVVAGLVPWNVPVRSEIKKLVPALLAGCSIVLKPAPETPFGAAALADICAEIGIPPGVVNVVTGAGSTGADLTTHPLVRKVAFTGSSETGSRIWAAVAHNFTRLQLELGGKSAAVVLDDADLDDAAPHLAAGIFAFSGQQCTATSRVLAPRSRQAEVVDALRSAAESHVLGDPFDAKTTMGPMVTDAHRQRVLGYMESGKSEGAVLEYGGGPSTDQPRGWFVEPTVFSSVTNGMRIAREEIFGPIVCVMPYDSEDEAVAIANDSEYGLGGAVFSGDPDRALAVARRIDSGFISVNHRGIGARVPFGGVKRSGIGRESGVEGYDSFLEYASYPLPPEQARALAGSFPAA